MRRFRQRAVHSVVILPRDVHEFVVPDPTRLTRDDANSRIYKKSINILHVVKFIFSNVMYGKIKHCEMNIARELTRTSY